MTSVFVLGVAVALVVVVAMSGEDRRVRRVLRWCAAVTMLVAVALQETEVAYGDLARVDLARRLVFLVTEASVVSLVMTFRRVPFPPRAFWGVWVLAGVVGVVECVLAVLMPVRADGLLYAYTEATRSPFVFGYYALYETGVAATAVVCSVGSVSVLVRTWQPFAARLSLALGTLAAACTVAYVGVGWFSLAGDPGFDYLMVRHGLYLATIVLLLVGVAVGGVRRIVVEGREVVTMRVGTRIVEPLWRGVTRLYPGVVLGLEDPSEQMRFLRLIIETNDVIHLVRYDSDPVLAEVVGGRDRRDPRVTAALLVHLLGDTVVPDPPGWRERVLMGLRVLLPRNEVTASLVELYELRRAFAACYPASAPAR